MPPSGSCSLLYAAFVQLVEYGAGAVFGVSHDLAVHILRLAVADQGVGRFDLAQFTFPDTVPDLSIGEDAFRRSGIRETVLRNRVTVMGRRAFAECSQLRRVTLGAGLEEGAFADCPALAVVDFPGSARRIGPDARQNIGNFSRHAGLKWAIICSGVKSAGLNTFADGSGLEEVFLSRALESIGSEAFAGYSALRRILFGGIEAQWSGTRSLLRSH